MKLLPCTLLIALLTGSCGGEEGQDYATPALAAEAGAQALAAGNLEVAEAAYEQAAQATEPAAKADALSGLYRVRIQGGSAAAAIAAVQRLIQECGGAVTAGLLKSLTDAAITELNAEAAEGVIKLAIAKFPESKQDFALATAAVEKLKTEGAGADLSSLGYGGD